jgi:hypothetical protein
MSGGRGRRPRKQISIFELVIGLLFVAFIAWQAAPQITSTWTLARSSPKEILSREATAYYPNCSAARAAGVAPIYAGQPGYREEMDGDLDGVACEPYR